MKRLTELEREHGLPGGSAARLAALLDEVAQEGSSITSVRDPRRGADVHVADSLSALVLEELRGAKRIVDLGSGAGFPGLALAVSLPSAHVTLVEGVGRKCDFMRRAADAAGIDNVTVVHSRAEEWSDGLGRADVVTARALAPLDVIAEYAAPLLRLGGLLVAYKGRLDPAEKECAARAARILGLGERGLVEVSPFEGSGPRNLFLLEKSDATPDRFPRRAGVARKRPLGQVRRP